MIGKDNSASNFLKNNKTTVEGIGTIKVAYEISKKYKIEMPIIDALYDVLFKLKSPDAVLKKLMERPLKNELF